MRAPSSTARATVAVRFRGEIERAASQGVALDDMALHLTLRDIDQLKRDHAVPVSDISFAGGMTYLGVAVLKADATDSVLRQRIADGV